MSCLVRRTVCRLPHLSFTHPQSLPSIDLPQLGWGRETQSLDVQYHRDLESIPDTLWNRHSLGSLALQKRYLGALTHDKTNPQA